MRRAALAALVLVLGCNRAPRGTPHVRVEEPVARVIASGAGAAYLRVVNDGDGDDRLVSVSSPLAADAQLHEVVKDGDLETMRRADDGFVVPAHGSLVLAKGGKHVMLFGIRAVAGGAPSRVPLVLAFARSGTVTIDVPAEDAMHAEAPPAANGKRVLRVCADPNNLPFSNEKGEGFEDAIAKLVADDLGASLEHTWSPQRRGFVRTTLRAGRCDVVMGVPAGSDMLATTAPYYTSGYVTVTRPEGPRVGSLASASLATMKIGMPLVGDDGANPPPAVALGLRGLARNLRGYSVYGDYRDDSPPADAIRALRRGEVDVTIAWGPVAGYWSRRGGAPLRVALLPEEEAPPGQPFRFAIAMGVRKKDDALRAELDAVLARRKAEIAKVLDAYGVPRP